MEGTMRNRFDRIGKGILRGALETGGAVANELEVPAADAQAVDTWFEPAPERAAERQRVGLLGRMAGGPTMFESRSPKIPPTRTTGST
jgi:hypothetical protein